MQDESKHTNLTENTVHPELQALRDGYTKTHRFFEILCLLAFTATSLFLLSKVWQIAKTQPVPYLAWLVVGGIITGILFADFGSGVVHWAADNWGSVDMPVLGEAMIRPFRHHHLAPKDMVSHDFIELNGFPSLFAQLPIVLGFLSLWLPAPYALFFGLMGAIAGISTVFTNQVHAWAHSDEPPAWVRWLQRSHLILTPENHALHHTQPFDRNYCITTGWSNTIARKLRIFEGIEWVVTKCTGIRPQHEMIEEQMKHQQNSDTPQT